MKRLLFTLPLLAACATVAEPSPVFKDLSPGEEANSPGQPTQRQILCRGPVAHIPDDDPGLALFADSDETLADRKVRLAVERKSSCDPEERE